MAEKMKAAVVHEFGKPLAIEEVDVPDVPPGQVLVNVVASGVCHTDLHAAEGDWPVKPSLPFIPGHEGVGYVAKLGAGVSTLKEGDRVGVPWLHTACGHCEYCITGWETLCDSQQMTGYTVNGGYADYVLADPAFVGRLPDNLDFAPAAPILCAGVTVYKALKVLDCKPGDWVAISGIGGLGHMAVQYAKAMGFHVIAVDITDEKLAFASSLGADMTVNAATQDAVGTVQAAIRGAHGVLVTAVSRAAFAQGLGMLHKRGTMSLVGLPAGSFDLPIFDVVLNAKTVRGSIVGTRKDLEESLMFAGEGKVKAHYSTDRLENINQIFNTMRSGQIEGRVARVAPSVDPSSRSVTVYVQVPNSDGTLRAGTFASGRIVSRVVDGAMVVPASALHEGKEGARPFVYRVANNRIDVVEVTPGLTDDAQGVVQILNGISANDRVVVGNVGMLGKGMQVRMAGAGGRGGSHGGSAQDGANGR